MPMSMPALENIKPQQLLQQLGFDQFRPGQAEVIECLFAGKSVAAIFPTGSGKSLCYQLPAMVLPHLTLMISPLLALMQDQLSFLQHQGINAASIDSTRSIEQINQTIGAVRAGEIKVLMISVERMKNEYFRRFIASVQLSLLVVDEAHCISEWGHNFRPDYLKLPQFRDQLNIPQVLLLTATATPTVIEDMRQKFGLDDVIQTGFYRRNLTLNVEAIAASQRREQLINYLHRHREQACIVYVTQQKTAQTLADDLIDAGHKASAYHAGLGSELRHDIQEQFMDGRLQVIVATIAFGMGIDKADIRHVIHYDLPKSIENYAQEIGRAGRDGHSSQCLVMANLASRSVLQNFVHADTPERRGIQTVLADIDAATARWETQGLALSTASNIRPLALKTLIVYLELSGLIEAQQSYYASTKFRLLEPEAQILERFDPSRREFLVQLIQSSNHGRSWYTADFDALYQQYSQPRSRAMKALDYLAEQHLIEVKSSGMTEVYKVNRPLPDLAQLSQELNQRFAAKEISEVARINHMIDLLQVDVCLSHALANYFGDDQAPAQCGHCSACRGKPAVLAETQNHTPIKDFEPWLGALASKIDQQFNAPLSSDLAAKFFAGLPAPWLSKIKASGLNGYAEFADQPFAKLRTAMEAALLHDQDA